MRGRTAGRQIPTRRRGHGNTRRRATLHTLEDVATILNVRPAQVYAMVRSGELPAVKLGGRGVWRVDRLQLEAYIERMHEHTAALARSGSVSEDPPAG